MPTPHRTRIGGHRAGTEFGTAIRELTCTQYMDMLYRRLNYAEDQLEFANEANNPEARSAHVTLCRIAVASASDRLETNRSGWAFDWLDSNLDYRQSKSHVLQNEKEVEITEPIKGGELDGLTHSMTFYVGQTRRGTHSGKPVPDGEVGLGVLQLVAWYLRRKVSEVSSNLPECNYCAAANELISRQVEELKEFKIEDCPEFRNCRKADDFVFPLGDRAVHHRKAGKLEPCKRSGTKSST